VECKVGKVLINKVDAMLDPVVLLGSACLLGHKCGVGCQKDTKSVSIASKMGHGEDDKEKEKFCWKERQSGKNKE
jgi:hypothetical protein